MKKFDFQSLNEVVFYDKLKSGLNVYLIPKKDFNKTLINMSIQVGAYTDNIINYSESVDIPKGTAHFLEHVLFHKKYGSIFSKYCEGILINAYTTNKSTNFVCSFSDNFKKNIGALFDLVWDFYISENIIGNEKNIILKELELNKDNFNDYLVEKTTELMFNEKIFNIEGTEKDIREINELNLKELYNKFYIGDNTSLIVIGNFDKEEIMKLIIEQDKKIRTDCLDKKYINKEKLPDKIEKNNWISSTEKICSLGINFDTSKFNDEKEDYKLECTFALILEALKYKYKKYRKIKVNINVSKQFNYIILYKQIEEYKSFSDEFIEDINNLKISEEDLEIFKNVIISQKIMRMDNLQDYMFNFVSYLEDNQMYLDFEEIIWDITISDLKKMKDKLADRENHINVFF